MITTLTWFGRDLTHMFCSADAVHTLTCALMLLNTDLHGQVRNLFVFLHLNKEKVVAQ